MTTPMTTPLNGGATVSTPSSSNPAMVSCSPSSSLLMLGFTHCLSQFSLIFICYLCIKFIKIK
ncbi:hypothetical protein AO381_0323 [Moraxella catarrhalis]|nr:hypothetical protein AO381_0323 [Moraxella catarrhalis]